MWTNEHEDIALLGHVDTVVRPSHAPQSRHPCRVYCFAKFILLQFNYLYEYK